MWITVYHFTDNSWTMLASPILKQKFSPEHLLIPITIFVCFYIKLKLESRIEGGTQVWSPHCLQYIIIINKGLRRFTKLWPGLLKYSYIPRFEPLKLKSHEEKTRVNDLIFFCLITWGQNDVNIKKCLSFGNNSLKTRGHSWKLYVSYCRLV